MKKTLTYISVLSILAAVSCSKNVEFDGGDYALTFEALTTEMETRAGEGEDFYHENDITTMDWFFFADEEGTQLRHLFQTENKTLKVTEAQITEFGLSGKSYLYAVANAPEAVRSKTTLADIKTVPVTTNFATSATSSKGIANEIVDWSGLASMECVGDSHPVNTYPLFAVAFAETFFPNAYLPIPVTLPMWEAPVPSLPTTAIETAG